MPKPTITDICQSQLQPISDKLTALAIPFDKDGGRLYIPSLKAALIYVTAHHTRSPKGQFGPVTNQNQPFFEVQNMNKDTWEHSFAESYPYPADLDKVVRYVCELCQINHIVGIHKGERHEKT